MPTRTCPVSRRARRALMVPLVLALGGPATLGAQEAGEGFDPPILPGDLILLEVWREEDYTGEYLVDQHYRVTLPLVGELDVRNDTELSLRTRVRAELEKELRNPSIQLFVLKRIRVVGAVMEPGVFNLNATNTVADALAMAGGRTAQAQEGSVILRRNGESIVEDVVESTRLSELAIQSNDELLVRQRGWLDRNLTPVVTGVTGLLTVIVLLFR